MFVPVKIKVLLDNSGGTVDVPGLLTPEGPFWPLLDYFLDRQLARSLSWMSKVCLSVRLFLECWRRSKFDPPCRLNFDPGLGAGIA
jgi:hypothetical protein